MFRVMLSLATLFFIAGCATGPMYWTRPDATAPLFRVDNQQCFDAAYLGYGTGNEQTYKACMRSKGWTRTQGTGVADPEGAFFRGPEGDDEFVPIDQEQFVARIRAQRRVDDGMCARPRLSRPPGYVCP